MIESRFKKAIMKLSIEFPFFSYIYSYCELVEDIEGVCPTIGVSQNGVIVYNKEWCDNLSNDEIKGVILHELLHLIYNHINEDLIKKTRFKLFNIAADIKVNESILKLGNCSNNIFTGKIDLPKEGIIPYGNMCYIDNYKKYRIRDIDKKNSHQIYTEILNMIPEEEDNNMKDTMDTHNINNVKVNSKIQNEDGSLKDEFNSDNMEEFIKEKILEASVIQKNAGEIPGFLDELIRGLEMPLMDWRDIIQQRIQRYDVSDYTWLKRHKNSRALGVYLPNTIKEGIKCRIYIDTSGSVSTEELKRYLSEINGIFEQYQGSRVDLITFDTQINGRYELEEEFNNLKISGRGGTDFRAVFGDTDIEEQNLVIIFSDGVCGYPNNRDNFDGEVIWCITKGRGIEYVKDKNINDTLVEVKINE